MTETDELRNEATTWLIFDPSQNYTGIVMYKPEPHKIIRYECIRKKDLLHGMDLEGAMKKRMAFEIAFATRLYDIVKFYDPVYTTIIMEEPIGSQNSAAAWAMAMASQGVVSASVNILRKPPIHYTEHDAKMYMFDRRTVEKQETLKHMWNYWFGQGIKRPEDKWPSVSTAERRKMMEAVADAMLILNLHLHKKSTE